MTNEQIDFYKCPHCGDIILVNKKDINCGIFRHGVLKDGMKQINPHASKEECNRLLNEGLIFGCGKPFKITEDKKIYICDYI